MASGSEWLAIVEMQQQELQELRALATTPERWSDDARSAFAASPGRSSTSSSSSSCCRDGGVLPLDLQRYANVCGDLEAMRQRLVLKDAKYRELRARANQMKREIEACRQDLKDSNAQVDALTVQFAHEQSAKQEAVERAALSMVQSEELALRLHDASLETERLRAETRLQSERTHQLVRRHSETHKETVISRETIARLEEAVRVADKEKNALLEQLQIERERHTQHVCVSKDEAELRRRVEEQERVLSLQTAQLERQQHAIVELHSARTALEEQVLMERSQHQCNVTQQLHANIALQQVADESVSQVRLLNVALAEREEQLRMQDEDIAAYAAWKRMTRQRELQREAVCSDTHETREKMERAVRFAEASRRKAIMELAETKRQLAQLQTAMVGVDTELQRMNKTFVVFRTREANVSRTLREYGRRNRFLLDTVRLMSSKVLQLSESLQRSEKRKQQVVIASHELKRGLVVERCQREDLLQQCVELESCLRSFQTAASESAERAQSVERENAVLQHAIKQLCAYSRELTQSQRALQRELSQLEVEGRVEPAVFG